jgi:hypothetical protein|tara:strand:+ start:182 stop:514 length:333 start_codon:yes stop_codon:yes gene_type:complete
MCCVNLKTAIPATTSCRLPGVRILSVVLLLVTTSVSCGDEDNRYDEEVRNNFLVECQVEADASSCAKLLSCIEGAMPQDEFLYEENILLLTDDLSDRMADVMARCISDPG